MNLLRDLPPGGAGEVIERLAGDGPVRIERIVSHGEASPDGFWYDQDDGEWVMLLQGEAKLRFADEAAARHLRAGDHLDIAAHRRHRVDWTAADQETVWLAVFYRSP